MALTPMQFGPKQEKKSGWDTVAQAMQMANTAVNIAGGISDLAKSAPPAPAGPPAGSAEIAAYKPSDMTPKISQPAMDPFTRRLMGGR